MIVKKECIKLLRKIKYIIKLRVRLKRMDDWWYLVGDGCFELFPLSFYYTHTEEEIKYITARELDKLRAIRDKSIAEHDLTPQDQQQKEVE